MIQMDESVERIRRTVYTMAAPDGSSIVAEVVGDVATITYGGSQLVIEAGGLPALTALAATLTAGVRAVANEPDPEPGMEAEPSAGPQQEVPKASGEIEPEGAEAEE